MIERSWIKQTICKFKGFFDCVLKTVLYTWGERHNQYDLNKDNRVDGRRWKKQRHWKGKLTAVVKQLSTGLPTDEGLYHREACSTSRKKTLGHTLWITEYWSNTDICKIFGDQIKLNCFHLSSTDLLPILTEKRLQ